MIELLESEELFAGPAFGVRRDRIRTEDGQETLRDVVDHPGAVTMVPVDDDGRLWFVRQYRHPTGEVLLEFPAGTLEEGESSQDCALRECREEIGMQPAQLDLLASFYLAPGYSSELNHLYLARGLTRAPLEGDEEETIEVERYTVDEVYDLIASGILRDAKTLAGLLLSLPLIDEGP